AVVVTLDVIRVEHTRADGGIEPACMLMSGHGLAQQATVPTGVNEAGIDLGLGVASGGTFAQPHQRFVGTANVDLELCAVVVSGSAVGVEFECSLQGRFGLCDEGRVLVLGEHAIEAPTLGPRRGKPRVDSEALIEQIAGPSPRCGFHPELHPTHEQIESLGTRGAEPRTTPNIISG